MLCEFEAKPMPTRNKTVGIDLGLTDLFITSDGQKSGNPKLTKRYEQKLAYLQRKLAKKQKGSNNRAKTSLKVARHSRKNSRLPYGCHAQSIPQINQREPSDLCRRPIREEHDKEPKVGKTHCPTLTGENLLDS